MVRLVTEGIGTFFLTLAVLQSKGELGTLGVGLVLMALVYSGARLSGAHYNPSITLAMLVQGKFQRDDLPGYWFAQFLGALLAALVAGFLLSFTQLPEASVRTNHVLGVLVGEFLGAFALAYVIFHVALPEKTLGNQYYGVAIGLVVTGLSGTFSEVSGAVFNPAVALGMAMSGHLAWSDLWLYFVATPLGAAAASTVFTLQQNTQKHEHQ